MIARKKVYLSIDVGTVNLAYCLLDENGMILLWKLVNTGASEYSKQCDKLITELDNINFDIKLDDGYNYDMIVIIERQLSINRKMGIVSGEIMMYFCLEARIFNKNMRIYISNVVFYSPKNKLKCYSPAPGDSPIVYKKFKRPYDERKYLAKQYCDRIIRRKHSRDIIEYFEKNKTKADDLSDCLLQGLAYIMGLR